MPGNQQTVAGSKWQDAWKPLVGLALILVFFGLAVFLYFSELVELETAGTIISALGSLVVAVAAFVFGVQSRASNRIEEQRILEAEHQVDEAAQHALSDPSVASLLEFNRRRIDQYHQLALRQANSAYRRGGFSAFAGLFVLLVGSGLALIAEETVGKLAAGSLAVVGTALGAYFGSTFLKLHETANRQLNYYFNQPLATSYHLNAERIADAIDDPNLRAEILRAIVTSMLEVGATVHRNKDELGTG